MSVPQRTARPPVPIALAPFGIVVLTFAGLLFVLALWLVTPPWYPVQRALELGWVPEFWAAPFAGHWRLGFEESAFTPCASPKGALVPLPAGPVVRAGGEAWWAELDSAAGAELRRRASAAAPRPWPDTTIFVAWRGDVSPADVRGHRSPYRRAIAVRRVYAVRAARADDCALATPALFAEE